MFKLFKNRKGFTLMEILVAVVIIGIFGAVAASAVPGMIERSHDRALTNQLATVQQAADRYIAENGKMPTSDGAAGQLDDAALISSGYLLNLDKNAGHFGLDAVSFGIKGGGTVFAVATGTWTAPLDTTVVYTAFDVTGSKTYADIK